MNTRGIHTRTSGLYHLHTSISLTFLHRRLKPVKKISHRRPWGIAEAHDKRDTFDDTHTAILTHAFVAPRSPFKQSIGNIATQSTKDDERWLSLCTGGNFWKYHWHVEIHGPKFTKAVDPPKPEDEAELATVSHFRLNIPLYIITPRLDVRCWRTRRHGFHDSYSLQSNLCCRTGSELNAATTSTPSIYGNCLREPVTRRVSVFLVSAFLVDCPSYFGFSRGCVRSLVRNRDKDRQRRLARLDLGENWKNAICRCDKFSLTQSGGSRAYKGVSVNRSSSSSIFSVEIAPFKRIAPRLKKILSNFFFIVTLKRMRIDGEQKRKYNFYFYFSLRSY